MNNSIVGVQRAKEKLEMACKARFQKNIADFYISISPINGKYVILADIHYLEFLNIIPKEVDGYLVTRGYKATDFS